MPTAPYRNHTRLEERVRRSRRGPVVLGLLLVVVIAGCKDLTGSSGFPSGTPNPTFYNNKTGALGMRNAAVFTFETALPQYLVDAGLLTDELEDPNTGASQGILLQNAGSVTDPLDERILPEGSRGGATSYSDLQNVRAFANQAIGALAAYDTAAADRDSAKILRGELYALEGYTEILLADFFCSGVPLSTLDYQKDFTYAPSSTTTQVYEDAIAKFNTALSLASASDSVVRLAQVGKGRAYLNLGQYTAAADDVSMVPDGFQYKLAVLLGGTFSAANLNFLNASATVSDREGLNGLPYRSSGDPRTADTVVAKTGTNGNPLPTPLTFPLKYSAALMGSGYTPFVLASGVEARLIQAEAALHAGNVTTWLADLNQLRTSGAATTVVVPDTIVDTLGYTGCTAVGACDDNGYQTSVNYASLVLVSSYSIDLSAIDVPGGPVDTCRAVNPNRNFSCVNPQVNVYADPTHTHSVTVSPVGTGGVSGLGQLTDPGTALARVSLLFQERAYWLFLTGHRQGDLRRLLRQYGSQYSTFRSQYQVYPTGPYQAPGTGLYGSDVTAPIPSREFANPLFHGCLNRQP